MKYFTIKELSHSDTALAKGIDNFPTAEAISNLTKLVDNVLDPLRENTVSRSVLVLGIVVQFLIVALTVRHLANID